MIIWLTSIAVRSSEFVNERIEALQHDIAEEHGFELVHHELVLYVRKK